MGSDKLIMVYRTSKRFVACAFLAAGFLIQTLKLSQSFAGEPAAGAPAADANFPNLKLIKNQAESGALKSQAKLGDYYFAKSDYTNAVVWYRKAAVQGEPDAQLCLASCLSNGRGVARNIEEAGRWQHRAATQIGGSKLLMHPASVAVVTNTGPQEITPARTPTAPPSPSPIASTAQAARIQILQAIEPKFQGIPLAVRPYLNP